MNIWLITIGEPLPNASESKKLRTALLADELVKRGHHVLSFVSAYNHLKKEWVYRKDMAVKIRDNYYLQVLKGTGYKKNISIQRFIDHRTIAKKFRAMAGQLSKPDIVVASMPPHDLAKEAVLYAKTNNIPVLVDIRDPWPDIFFSKFPVVIRKPLEFFFRKEFKIVKTAMKHADGLLATTSTLLDWGLTCACRKVTEQDKIIYLGQKRISENENRDTLEKWEKISTLLKEKFIVFFLGTISHSHSPLILVEAAKKIISHEKIHFVIAGNGELFSELKRKSEKLKNVTLVGWLNENDIGFWLCRSKIGVCTTPMMIDILPNKAGTYLSAKLPVISAFQGDFKKMIEKYQIGFYYPPNDVNELLNSILKLYEDTFLYDKMSENAKNVFEKMFDADKIYSEYVKHIEQIVKNRQNQQIINCT